MVSLKKSCIKSEKYYLKNNKQYFMKIGFMVINFLKLYNFTTLPVNDTTIIKCVSILLLLKVNLIPQRTIAFS